jgi:HD-like signal output (HDOD) protein
MGMKAISDFLASFWRAPSAAVPAAPAEASTIGRFPVQKLLGRGTQGAVYLARDPDLDRPVAIKLVGNMPGQSEPGWPQARNLASLRHPNIVALHEFGKHRDLTYLVFEYIDGTTLAEELKSRGALPPEEACKAMLQITDAVAHAHAHGILHLDLNPTNVMRDREGNLRVMDFDVSRRADAPPATDFIVGTVAYMAPEHFTTFRLDKRTDVYALGQMFYTLLTGSPAVTPGPRAETIQRICKEEIDAAALQSADPGGALARLIRRATAKDPAQRFEDARAMHEALAAELAPPKLPDDAATRGVVAFLLKRMEHRGDFPAVSRTLAEINRIAGDEKTTLARISGAVLRDYALTNRLLKLANSAHYPHLAGKVATVSDAIKLLGFNEVRLVCSGLACFGHFTGGRQKRLREESTASFIAGLIARHLAVQSGIKDVEEAFIAGMLFHLGKALALFYFPEDHWEIENLVARGATPDEAATRILGISLPQLGRAIGEIWGLPAAVLDCMSDKPGTNDAARRLRQIVRFANALAGVDPARDAEGMQIAAEAAKLQPPLGPADVDAMLQAALEKFKAFAPALEIDADKSVCVQRVEQWLASRAIFRSSITP